VEVAASVARGFEQAAREPDPRDPRVEITAISEAGDRDVEPREEAPRAAPQRPRPDVPPSRHRAPAPSKSAFAPSKPYAAGTKPGFTGAKKPAFSASKPAFAAPKAHAAAPKAHAAAPKSAARDEAPKRPARRVIVDAPPPRKPKKK
jgi:hypothetical protein